MFKAFSAAVLLVTTTVWAQSDVLDLRGFIESQTQAAPFASGVVANAVVSLNDKGWGCMVHTQVWRALHHHSLGETAAMDRIIFDSGDACLPWDRLTPGQTFTVLQVRGALAQIATTTPSQKALAAKSRLSNYKDHAYWIPAHWLKPSS